VPEYKIVRSSDGYGVEIRSPGSFASTTGFPAEAAAAAWIAEQKLHDGEETKREVR
jgi:hypothetical protein